MTLNCLPLTPPASFSCLTARSTPICSWVPTKAEVPVSGVYRPILITSLSSAALLSPPVSAVPLSPEEPLHPTRENTSISARSIDSIFFM